MLGNGPRKQPGAIFLPRVASVAYGLLCPTWHGDAHAEPVTLDGQPLALQVGAEPVQPAADFGRQLRVRCGLGRRLQAGSQCVGETLVPAEPPQVPPQPADRGQHRATAVRALRLQYPGLELVEIGLHLVPYARLLPRGEARLWWLLRAVRGRRHLLVLSRCLRRSMRR